MVAMTARFPTKQEVEAVVLNYPDLPKSRHTCLSEGRKDLTFSQKVIVAAHALADKAWAWDDDALCSCLHTSGCGVRYSEIHTEWENVVGLAKRFAGMP